MSSQPEFTCPSPEELAGLIPGYRVTELVSTGKRGALYQAQQISLDRTVTIKVLPPEIGTDPMMRQAFEAEAKTMARLNDPNLVDVFDFGSINGMLFIIMEHVPGSTLHETTHGHHVDEKESARLVADLCHGLHHAHEAGIIHRALNPHNVLINSEAQAKIVDFGIASLTGIDTGAEVSGYSAPELFQQDSPVDAKADIYSAGMILYELIVGQLPSNPYTAPSQLRNCRPEIDEIVYRAIQPDPAKRYATAAEMAQALEDMLDKAGVAPTQQAIKTMLTAATPTAAPLRPATYIPVPKSSNNTAVIITVLVLAIVVGLVAIIIKSSATPPSKPAVAQQQEAQPKPEKKQPKPKPKPNHPERNKGNNRLTNLDQPIQPKTPSPAPTPEPDPEPKKKNDNKVVENKPEPSPPPIPAPPEFDIEAWLLKARNYMQNKGRFTLADYDKALLANIDRFERDVKRVIRKLDRNIRKPAQIKADEAFAEFRTLGRLPNATSKDTPKQIKNLYSGALADQKKIEVKFRAKFTELRIIYIQGLDKQITTLKKEGNKGHADSLEEEISLTQKSMDRFIRILRDQDPDKDPKEKGKDKKKEN